MTGYRPGIKVDGIKLAQQLDYQLIAATLDCSKHPSELRCRRHNSVWIHDRCMVANAIANRMASKILRLEHRITELAHRPTAHELMEAKQEAHREGFQEAMEVIRLVQSPDKAWMMLKRYWKNNYGSAKAVQKGPNSP